VRYAEVLFNYAEAANVMACLTPAVHDDINAIKAGQKMRPFPPDVPGWRRDYLYFNNQ